LILKKNKNTEFFNKINAGIVENDKIEKLDECEYCNLENSNITKQLYTKIYWKQM